MPPRRAARRSLGPLFGAALVACATTGASEESPAAAVLFLGNSLTYTNDLPEMVRRVAEAAGAPLETAMVAGANMAVVDHTDGHSDAPARIAGRRWGFVVMQQGPTPAGMCRDTLVIAAMRLAPGVRAAGARPVSFAPWARRGASGFLPTATASAEAAARAVGGAVVPVGDAWRRALEADPTAPLYGGDGYHPAPAGTLLAAITVYERLYGGDARELDADAVAAIPSPRLAPALARTLLDAAHAANAAAPPDPAVPAPPDTTVVSTVGGPC